MPSRVSFAPFAPIAPATGHATSEVSVQAARHRPVSNDLVTVREGGFESLPVSSRMASSPPEFIGPRPSAPITPRLRDMLREGASWFLDQAQRRSPFGGLLAPYDGGYERELLSIHGKYVEELRRSETWPEEMAPALKLIVSLCTALADSDHADLADHIRRAMDLVFGWRIAWDRSFEGARVTGPHHLRQWARAQARQAGIPQGTPFSFAVRFEPSGRMGSPHVFGTESLKLHSRRSTAQLHLKLSDDRFEILSHSGYLAYAFADLFQRQFPPGQLPPLLKEGAAVDSGTRSKKTTVTRNILIPDSDYAVDYPVACTDEDIPIPDRPAPLPVPSASAVTASEKRASPLPRPKRQPSPLEQLMKSNAALWNASSSPAAPSAALAFQFDDPARVRRVLQDFDDYVTTLIKANRDPELEDLIARFRCQDIAKSALGPAMCEAVLLYHRFIRAAAQTRREAWRETDAFATRLFATILHQDSLPEASVRALMEIIAGLALLDGLSPRHFHDTFATILEIAASDEGLLDTAGDGRLFALHAVIIGLVKRRADAVLDKRTELASQLRDVVKIIARQPRKRSAPEQRLFDRLKAKA